MLKEKWILTRTLHMGFCKETFEKGAILELHENEFGNQFIMIGARRFEKTQDLEILKRQTEKYPNDPWIIDYEENFEDQVEEESPKTICLEEDNSAPIKLRHKADTRKHMKIVQSDVDLMENEIDISHTKNTKIQANKKAKEEDLRAARQMNVVVGQENISQDLPIEPRQEMKIVNGDEEFGMAGNAYSSLNAGMVSSKTAKEVAKMREEAFNGSGNSQGVETLKNVVKATKKVVPVTKAKKVESKVKRGRPTKEKNSEAIAEQKGKRAAYQREYRARKKAEKDG